MAKGAASKCGTKENREVEKGRESIRFRKSEAYGMNRNETAGWNNGYLDGGVFLVLFLFSLCERVSVSVHCGLR